MVLALRLLVLVYKPDYSRPVSFHAITIWLSEYDSFPSAPKGKTSQRSVVSPTDGNTVTLLIREDNKIN
jgi:hypothetical protein